jgi:surface carbohydrate biosynthesis protein
MRIHLLCDHKWRDLPNLTVIKLQLEALGHRVLLSTTKDAVPMTQAFRPDCVVFNHLFGRVYAELSANLRNAGIAVVMLPTEGAMRPELVNLAAGEFADFGACELFMNWSEPAAQLLRRRWSVDEEAAPVIGCTRFDFYHPPFKAAITPREIFCRQHGLDASRPIVTWATQYGFAHLCEPSRAREKFLFESKDVGVKECLARIGLDLAEVPRLHAEARDATSEAFFTLASAMPSIQFVIRPHPVENRDYYRRKMRDLGVENIRFCPSDYIWNVLNASDLHLHRQCTTAVEAWHWGKPTIEMGMDFVPQWSWADREVGSDFVTNTDELITTVQSYLDGREVERERRQYRADYIRSWFGPSDGRRCATAAGTLHTFLERRGRRRSYFSSLGKVRASPRLAAGAVARYALGRRPNEPFFRSAPVSQGPEDKLITKRDIDAYSRLVAGSIA